MKEPNAAVPLAGATAGELKVRLPQDPDPLNPNEDPDDPDPSMLWPAGQYTLWATFTFEKDLRVTNELAFSLAPIIVSIDALDKASLKINFNPMLRQGQKASLLIGNKEILPVSPVLPTYQLIFDASLVSSGDHPVRLRIDGVESQFIDLNSRPPTFIKRATFDANDPKSITVANIK
ncbi:Uncharacterised protein [uncultured archaeon]|nr:Uncharacterised protein [uncultured archaeon]